MDELELSRHLSILRSGNSGRIFLRAAWRNLSSEGITFTNPVYRIERMNDTSAQLGGPVQWSTTRGAFPSFSINVGRRSALAWNLRIDDGGALIIRQNSTDFRVFSITAGIEYLTNQYALMRIGIDSDSHDTVWTDWVAEEYFFRAKEWIPTGWQERGGPRRISSATPRANGQPLIIVDAVSNPTAPTMIEAPIEADYRLWAGAINGAMRVANPTNAFLHDFTENNNSFSENRSPIWIDGVEYSQQIDLIGLDKLLDVDFNPPISDHDAPDSVFNYVPHGCYEMQTYQPSVGGEACLGPGPFTEAWLTLPQPFFHYEPVVCVEEETEWLEEQLRLHQESLDEGEGGTLTDVQVREYEGRLAACNACTSVYNFHSRIPIAPLNGVNSVSGWASQVARLRTSLGSGASIKFDCISCRTGVGIAGLTIGVIYVYIPAAFVWNVNIIIDPVDGRRVAHTSSVPGPYTELLLSEDLETQFARLRDCTGPEGPVSPTIQIPPLMGRPTSPEPPTPPSPPTEPGCVAEFSIIPTAPPAVIGGILAQEQPAPKQSLLQRVAGCKGCARRRQALKTVTGTTVQQIRDSLYQIIGR